MNKNSTNLVYDLKQEIESLSSRLIKLQIFQDDAHQEIASEKEKMTQRMNMAVDERERQLAKQKV